MVNTSTSQRTHELLATVAHSNVSMARLLTHARQRLARARQSLPSGALQHLDAEDVVQQAFAETSLGSVDSTRGRHPRARHLTDEATFTHWLGSVINSLIANQRTVLAARARHAEPAALEALACPKVSVREQVDFRLRLAALLQALRAEFAHRPALLALLDQWERDGAHLDRLPGTRFNAHVVRRVARRLLQERPELRP